ncbi:MAG TPA: hypothetical protein VFI40_15505 [Nocardioides sp.]|nr:hypothetical protein [Nocardioides sp.]
MAHKIGPAQLDRTVNEAIGRYMPEEVQRLAEASWDKRHVTVHDQRPRGQDGPTCSCNIAPLCRRHHRLKTHSPWSYLVLDPGTYLWTSPHGYQFLRDPVGTVDVSQDRPRPKPPDT